MASLSICITDLTHSITVPLRVYICLSFAKCFIIPQYWNTHLWGKMSNEVKIMNYKQHTDWIRPKKKEKKRKTKERKKYQCFEKTKIKSLALLK